MAVTSSGCSNNTKTVRQVNSSVVIAGGLVLLRYNPELCGFVIVSNQCTDLRRNNIKSHDQSSAERFISY